jgi:hypothetical protein
MPFGEGLDDEAILRDLEYVDGEVIEVVRQRILHCSTSSPVREGPCDSDNEQPAVSGYSTRRH